MSLIQPWYGLSNYEAEDWINDSISFGYFCGMPIVSVAPDHRALIESFSDCNDASKDNSSPVSTNQCPNRSLWNNLKTGVFVDASGIKPLLKPKGKTNYKVTQDCLDEEKISLEYRLCI